MRAGAAEQQEESSPHGVSLQPDKNRSASSAGSLMPGAVAAKPPERWLLLLLYCTSLENPCSGAGESMARDASKYRPQCGAASGASFQFHLPTAPLICS